jgi:hypothetical protein
LCAPPNASHLSVCARRFCGREAVIDILNRELVQIMRQAGTPTLASITREHVVSSTWR